MYLIDLTVRMQDWRGPSLLYKNEKYSHLVKESRVSVCEDKGLRRSGKSEKICWIFNLRPHERNGLYEQEPKQDY